MPPFAQSLRHAQILILEILYVFLWLKFLRSLTLDKIEHFEIGSKLWQIRAKIDLPNDNKMFGVPY